MGPWPVAAVTVQVNDCDWVAPALSDPLTFTE